MGGISERQISAMVLTEVSRGVSLFVTELNRRVNLKKPENYSSLGDLAQGSAIGSGGPKPDFSGCGLRSRAGHRRAGRARAEGRRAGFFGPARFEPDFFCIRKILGSILQI